MFEIGLAGLRGFDVENPAGFVEGQATGGIGVGGGGVAFGGGGGVFGGSGGLFVCLCEGSTEDSGTGDDDLGDYTVGLGGLVDGDYARNKHTMTRRKKRRRYNQLVDRREMGQQSVVVDQGELLLQRKK